MIADPTEWLAKCGFCDEYVADNELYSGPIVNEDVCEPCVKAMCKEEAIASIFGKNRRWQEELCYTKKAP